MTLLVVGASHRTADATLLDRLAMDSEGASTLAGAATEQPYVFEALVLNTCNRVEIYAEVEKFHPSVEDLTGLLVDAAGLPAAGVLPAVYVHYDEAAAEHLFTVATGLDSLVVGETQILGQVRDTLNRGQRDNTVGPALNSLFQQGLRVGKRAHAETGIDSAGQSMVSVALTLAEEHLETMAGARVCVVGAGSMAALACGLVRRQGAGDITVASRTPERARRLAETVQGMATALDDLPRQLACADVVISCTGATAAVVSAQQVRAAMRDRQRQLVVIDLALPHDVEPAVADIPGVTLIGLAALADASQDRVTRADITAVEAIIAGELDGFSATRSAARVAPTVVALRSLATGVVADELGRLWARLDNLTPEQRGEITSTVRRVADKLLHEPTVRIKQLAGQAPSASYADALAELFALDPSTRQSATPAGERR